MQDKVVIITGSSRGIGRATAKLAKQQGAKVVVHGKTDSNHLEELAKELGAFKIVCDVADKEAVFEAVNSVIEKFGRVDAVANVAGIVRPKPVLDMEDEDWQEEFNVNVLGTVHFCQAAIPHMQIQGSGSIVNISSMRGMKDMVSERGTSYSMTKASVIALTEALAKQFAPNIRVNSIAPGFTETDMSKTWNEKVWNQAKSTLLQRVGQPEEIAEAILFMLSDKASFITGQTLLVDGGYGTAGK